MNLQSDKSSLQDISSVCSKNSKIQSKKTQPFHYSGIGCICHLITPLVWDSTISIWFSNLWYSSLVCCCYVDATIKKSFLNLFHKYRYYLCKTILIKLISHEFFSATTKDNFLFPDTKLHCILFRYM